VVLDVRELAFDDENEAKFAAHGVDVMEVQEVLGGSGVWRPVTAFDAIGESAGKYRRRK
jgi:hypothetical protein